MSVFAPYMQRFVDAKEAVGFSRKYFESNLGLLDRFFIEEKVQTTFITSALIDKWGQTLTNNSYKTVCSKYSILAQFTKYMNNIGFPCYVPRIPKNKANTYVPYIFTHEQVRSIFTVCDSLVASDHGNMDSRLFSIPVILRLLYGTGMRVSEAASLLNQDINLEKRVITIRKTKNQRQRLIPVCPSLYRVLSQYVEAGDRLPLPHADNMESPFFISPSGLPLSQSRIYAWFRIILKKCGIPHCAKKGPRVHDLRHTFAVHSLMHQVENGADVYCTLPILTVFLGHKKLSDTETYVRLTQEMYPDILKQEISITRFLYPSLPNNPVAYEK